MNNLFSFFVRYIFLSIFLFHFHLLLEAIPLKHFAKILKYLLFYLSFSISILFSSVFEAILLKHFAQILTYLLIYELFYFQLNHQLLLQFFEVPSLKSFYSIFCRFLTAIKTFLNIHIAHVFSNFSCMCTNIFRKR